jgi:hypothetical protein
MTGEIGARVGELLDAAQSSTGLHDFGDGSFRDGLERLVRALRTEARLNPLGESALRQKVVTLLSQRLEVEDWYRRHPEIADEQIDAPLIGLGLPRTGSTALSFLLAQDPAARSLLWWEAEHPCPPPSTVSGADPRVERARSQAARQGQPTSRIEQMVPVSALGPAECQELMALDFKAQIFQAMAQIPSYSQWLLHEADLTSTYRYESRVLKLLQWGSPHRPWRLKAPTHLIYLDALDQVFPNARFVMTHRDVADVIVSVADLYAEVVGWFTDSVDLRYLGELNVEQWSLGTRRAITFRGNGREHRFFDIDFRDMQREPIASVQSLYRWLDEPVSSEFEAAMRAWSRANAETRQSMEHRTAEAFGIDLERVRGLFADYTARFAPRSDP